MLLHFGNTEFVTVSLSDISTKICVLFFIITIIVT